MFITYVTKTGTKDKETQLS